MKFSLILLFISISIAETNDTLEKLPGDYPAPYIVGGAPVSPACPDCKYPFMASIQSNWGGHFCGGSLVRPDWVITAAHCVQGESTNNLRVKLGLHNVNGTTGSETKYVDQVIIHPNYNSNSMNNDYALLHLTSDSNFEPIQLITNNSHDNEPVMSTTMGWGATYSGGWGSDILLEVDVPIDNSCGYYSNNEITSNMVCAGDYNGGEDSCQGDSGGPLIMTNNNNEFELIGIVSWGYGCADAGYPGVYSKVYSKLDWFFSYIGEPINLNYGCNDSYAINYNEEFDGCENGTYDCCEYLIGDINNDEIINILDIVNLVNLVLTPSSQTNNDIFFGDINNDNILNVLDIVNLVNLVLNPN